MIGKDGTNPSNAKKPSVKGVETKGLRQLSLHVVRLLCYNTFVFIIFVFEGALFTTFIDSSALGMT